MDPKTIVMWGLTIFILVLLQGVSVNAQKRQVRLAGGSKSTRGRVEILHKGVWGTICDDRWDNLDAHVICRMLGFSGGRAQVKGHHGAGNGTIWLDEVQCSGNEETIDDCVKNDWGQHDCKHIEDAGVQCLRSAGPTYTRWGRKVCPSTAELVYEGFAGGSHYTHTGGASNYLCLPKDPLWGRYTPTNKASGAYVYGAEYEVWVSGRSGMFSNKNSKALQDFDVPCAVCQVKEPGTVIMLPARNRCYSGWTLEYAGYLMSGNSGENGRTTYVCVDNDPEVEAGSLTNYNQARFYHVQSKCGSLNCPPYVDNRELTCAVCSKEPE